MLDHVCPFWEVDRDWEDVDGLSPIRYPMNICPKWEQVNHPLTHVELGVAPDILLQLERHIIAASRKPVHVATVEARASTGLLLRHLRHSVLEWGERAKPRRRVGTSPRKTERWGRWVRHGGRVKKMNNKVETHKTSFTHTSPASIRATGFPLSQE